MLRREDTPLAVQMISYDLRRPGQDYTGLFDAIKALGPWWHCLESVWLVRTPLASGRVRDVLRSHLDANDSLLVAKLGGNLATLGLPGNCTGWLRKFLAA
jgi:hypothetical protein